MAAQKKQFIVTPLGVAAPYAALQKPDYGNEQYPQPRGEYKLNLMVPVAEAAPLIKRLQKMADDDYADRLKEHKANPPKVQPGKKPVQPRQGDMPWYEDGQGNVVFKIKCYASYEKDGEKKEINIKVADARGKKIEAVPNISGGSKLKARFSVFPYGWNPTMGASIKLQLDGIMLVELVEFGGGDDDWGDEVVEGGYTDDSYDERGFDNEPEPNEDGPAADDDF